MDREIRIGLDCERRDKHVGTGIPIDVDTELQLGVMITIVAGVR